MQMTTPQPPHVSMSLCFYFSTFLAFVYNFFSFDNNYKNNNYNKRSGYNNTKIRNNKYPRSYDSEFDKLNKVGSI